MIDSLRQQYNASFTEEKYQEFLKEIHPRYKAEYDFRIAESPVFVSKVFQKKMDALFETMEQLILQPGYRNEMADAVPPQWRVPNETQQPAFYQIDFAVCKDDNGELEPQLIEFQGITTLFAYQNRLSQAYRNHFAVPDNVDYLYNGLTEEEYLQILKEVIIADADPEQVVLMDIMPRYQKTRIDFWYTWTDLGIRPVCISNVKQRDRQLFYKRDGVEVPIKRIYNRVIFDELERRRNITQGFDPTAELDVEWVAHPNWYFLASKFALPHIKAPYVPEANRLSHYEGHFPDDVENYVLKPLYSFAGAGVEFDVQPHMLHKPDPHNWLLQRKVHYAPVIPTPDGPAKTEIRIMCVWHEGKLKRLTNLARLSKGKMLGVDFNKDKSWVGGSAVFMER